MALNLLKDKGVPLARQRFTWKDLVQRPFSKLDDDAFTRVRVILMNGNELPRSKLRGIKPPFASPRVPPVWRGDTCVACEPENNPNWTSWRCSCA
jgi:hypothetical protein